LKRGLAASLFTSAFLFTPLHDSAEDSESDKASIAAGGIEKHPSKVKGLNWEVKEVTSLLAV